MVTKILERVKKGGSNEKRISISENQLNTNREDDRKFFLGAFATTTAVDRLVTDTLLLLLLIC